MAEEKFQATGRRKTAIARVTLAPGTGKVTINNRTIEDFFKVAMLRICAVQPLNITDNLNKFDVSANVKGGGTSGQAEAIRHGITRALLKTNDALRTVLKSAGFLRRDPRMKERKKYGQKGARRRFQWTKR
ncbi:MAG: 30S ribosomal protein S9 [Candidatus Omnitrophota bacterium]